MIVVRPMAVTGVHTHLMVIGRRTIRDYLTILVQIVTIKNNTNMENITIQANKTGAGSNRRKLIVVGLVAVLVLGTVLFITRRGKPDYEQVSLVKTELYVDPKIEDLASFVSELPYETEGFMVEYYPKSGFYFITLRGSNDQEVNENKNKASQWINAHSAFSQTNAFCGMKYQIVLPPKQSQVDLDTLKGQLVMPGCNYTEPENI